MPRVLAKVVSVPLAELIERGDSATARGAAAVEEFRKILRNSMELREGADLIHRQHQQH